MVEPIVLGGGKGGGGGEGQPRNSSLYRSSVAASWPAAAIAARLISLAIHGAARGIPGGLFHFGPVCQRGDDWYSTGTVRVLPSSQDGPAGGAAPASGPPGSAGVCLWP